MFLVAEHICKINLVDYLPTVDVYNYILITGVFITCLTAVWTI